MQNSKPPPEFDYSSGKMTLLLPCHDGVAEPDSIPGHF
jgi:hypothetical protein